MPDTLSAAIDFARRGFRVFPLRRALKRPALKGWQRLATGDEATLRRWFGPKGEFADCDAGAVTGEGFFVFDADVKDGQAGLASFDLAQMMGVEFSLVVATPSGGKHGYVRIPPDRIVPNKVKAIAGYPGVDTRGRGGLVKIPGAAGYRIIAENPDADLPPDDFIDAVCAGYVARERSNAEPVAELDQPQAIAAATAYLTHNAPEAIEGAGGNDATYRVAARCKDFGLSQSATVDLMLDHWNETRASPPWEPDDLAGIVANAFVYGTTTPGAKTAEAEFDVIEIADRRTIKPKPSRKMRRVRFDEAVALATSQVNPALIEDILDQHSFGVFYGPSNSGKTFLALSMAYHVAMGLSWCEHPVAQGAVLYVVAEGGRGINKRIAALAAHYKPQGLPALDLVPSPVDLRSNDADMRRIVRLAEESAADHGQPLRLIVVDTLSRALAGGDENASTDMGAFIANIDRLREATSATVVVVHHTGKNVANGARGWSGLRAAIDTEVEIHEGGVISFEKQRDLDKIKDIRFHLEILNLGAGPNGKDVTSCVLLPLTAAEAEFEAQMDLPPLAKDYFDALVDLAGPEAEAVSTAEWSKAFDDFMTAGHQPRLGDKTLQRLRSTLVDSGWVERVDNARWKPVTR